MKKNLFEILRFDEQKTKFYFNYLGNSEKSVVVIISCNDLTLHAAKMNLGVDLNCVYFVGYNGNALPKLKKINIKFCFDNEEESYNFEFPDLQELPYHNINFKTNVFDSSFYTFNEIFIKRIYDNKLVRIYEKDIVVDIGSNYGFFYHYAKEFNPSRIICFEPSKKTFNFLNQNVQSEDNLQKAISGLSGIKKFSDNAESSASSAIVNDGDYEVETIGINDLHSFLNLSRIDFLKIDCEGAEKQIFEEISETTLNNINKIVVEFHSQEIKNIIIDKLNRFDYGVEKVTDDLIFAYNKKYFRNKKKIALVSTYCDTQEKKDIFLNLAKKIKSFGCDVIAISPLPLDKEHIEACDYLYFTKENPILVWPVRLFTFWKEWLLADGRISTLQRGVGDYSWAALYHVKKLTQIAMDYDYDIFYHMIYDLEVDEVVERAIKNFEGNIVYPRRDPHHPETLWETTLHFMSFDRDLMKKIEKEITLEGYLSTNGVAEGEVLKWKNKFKIEGSEHPVKDLIFYWKDHDFFNYSPVQDFKLFLSKNDEIDIWLGKEPVYSSKLPSKFRIFFYHFESPLNLTLVINEKEYEIQPIEYNFIEFEEESKQIQNLSLIYKGEKYDLSDEYKKISMNQIYYNHRP